MAQSFGPFSYDGATGTLWRDGDLVTLGARATSVLGALLAASGGVVARDALIAAAWGDTTVEDGNLAVQIAGLRKALGPRGDGDEWIATVPRVGYRLLCDTPPNAEGRPALAVLPFLTMSDDPAQEHVADGIVEDLITAFSQFRNFGVIARQSSFVYKNRQFDIRDAARALGVRYLLEGSVRRAGDRVRVTAQLIDGRNGEHIWAEKLDGPLGDIFEFQDRVTESVVGLIEPEIRKAEIGRARRKHPESLDAHALYWRALPLLQASNSDGYGEAVDYLDRAVALEPDYTPILSMAAYAHDKRRDRGLTPPGVDDHSAAVSLCARALAADSSDPFAILVGAIIEGSKGDRAAALTIARRAYKLNPNHVLICNVTGWLNWSQGNYDEAIACSSRALKLSPIAPEGFWAMNNIANSHLSAGRAEDSLLWALRSLGANSDQVDARIYVIASYALLGQLDDARRALAGLVALKPETTVGDLLSSLVGPHDLHLREGLRRLEEGATVPPDLRTINRG